jgi:hypothetical protein
MARRPKNSTGRRRSNFRNKTTIHRRQKASVATTARRRNTPRRRLGSTATPLSKRRTQTRLLAVIERRGSTETPRPNRNKLQNPTRHRRTPVRTLRGTRPRLSTTLLPVRGTNENASGVQTKRSLCTRKKQARRAIVIATGHGGINHANKYRRQKKC